MRNQLQIMQYNYCVDDVAAYTLQARIEDPSKHWKISESDFQGETGMSIWHHMKKF
jgi:polyphosphate kinase 2 (PPK2 family)